MTAHTDLLIPGIAVGHASDATIRTGVTVVLPDAAVLGAVHVMGGSPGARETDLLSPEQSVDQIDAIVLSGGSAFGLDAASGVQAWLREAGRGFLVEPFRVPIVPGAILFDLRNGGDKNWGLYPPYREMGYAAAANASTNPGLGAVGAGFGAMTATTPGGVGIASQTVGSVRVASLAAVNAVGSPLVGDTPHFWAAPFEVDGEFGGRGVAHPWPTDATRLRVKPGYRLTENTTISVVMTDAKLTKAELKRLAIAAHDGYARALYPVHTAADGDLVFALSTGTANAEVDVISLGAAAANTMARAIARGVFEAMQPDG